MQLPHDERNSKSDYSLVCGTIAKIAKKTVERNFSLYGGDVTPVRPIQDASDSLLGNNADKKSKTENLFHVFRGN